MTTKLPDLSEAPPERKPPADLLAADLTHDINNLLLAMTACLELIRGRSSEARIVEIATRGLRTLDRGAQLIERLTTMTDGRRVASRPPPEPSPPQRQSTILVIDDDQDVRLILVELLQSLGYRVIEASDGPTGIAAAERDPPPDLAIVDYALPGLNGGQVVSELLQRRPNLPVVFATGYNGPDALDPRWRHLPILHKPFRIAELARTVAAALEDR